jgi:hypothetical protein
MSDNNDIDHINTVATYYLKDIHYKHFTLKAWTFDDYTILHVFEKLFENYTKHDRIEIHSVYGNTFPPIPKDPNTLYVQFSYENTYNDPNAFDINFIQNGVNHPNVVLFFTAYYHMLYYNASNVPSIMNIEYFVKPRVYEKKERKFCIFNVSNHLSIPRVYFYFILSHLYKQPDSCGKFLNNGVACPPSYSSSEYCEFISQYKFMICFENECHDYYFTEKLINAYYSGTIPIFWGFTNIEKYLNMDAIIYLKKDYTQVDVFNVINQIMYLDNNEDAYKAKFENTFFKDGILPDEFNIVKIQEKIHNILDK